MFKKAEAIFIKGGNNGYNNFADFKTKIKKGSEVKIRLTAHYFYKLFVNERAVAFGPCRSARGYSRVDEIDLSNYLSKEINDIDIIVAGYNCKSLSTCQFNSFVTAEVISNGEIVAYTGKDFIGYEILSRVKKVNRYSKQRHYAEVINFNLGNDFNGKQVEIEKVTPPKYLTRGVNYPTYTTLHETQSEAYGEFKSLIDPNEITPNYSWLKDYGEWGVFNKNEIDYHTIGLLKSLQYTLKDKNITLPITLKANEYAVFDLENITTGFIGFEYQAVNNANLALGFTEYSAPYEFSYVDYFNTNNAFEYFLKDGNDTVETFEPFTAKKILIAVKEGEVTINNIYIKKYEGNFDNLKKVEFTDENLNLIYEASTRTFIQNSLDLYTDCPSRERAGWLCDSYFTAKTEYFLTGNTTVEDNFLENYALFDNQEGYEEGMIPMTYPSDNNGQFIPQWSMWFIIELHEYIYERKGKFPFSKFEKVVNGLLKYYKKYENENGLLEKLSNWNFVEWSKANDLTNGVNIPTNFLYAKVLDCVADFYNDNSYRVKANDIRNKAINLSFDGNYFHDLAVRNDKGELIITSDITEISQYYAIVFADIDINSEKYAKLKNSVKNLFTSDRKTNLEIEKINMFIGVYLKLLAVEKLNDYELLLTTIKDYFLPMAKKTGTLWENVTLRASLCHGFASFSAVQMEKCAKALNLIK